MTETTPRPDVPDELIVRAAKASSVHFENCDDGETWQDCPDCRRAYDRAHYAVAAVVPEIARQVRERVAADIDAERAGGTEHWDVAMDHAARIARGES